MGELSIDKRNSKFILEDGSNPLTLLQSETKNLFFRKQNILLGLFNKLKLGKYSFNLNLRTRNQVKIFCETIEIRLIYAVGRGVPNLMAWNRGAKIEFLMERNLAVSSFKVLKVSKFIQGCIKFCIPPRGGNIQMMGKKKALEMHQLCKNPIAERIKMKGLGRISSWTKLYTP